MKFSHSSYSIYLKRLTPAKVALGASVALLGFTGTANAVTLTLNNPYTSQAILDQFDNHNSLEYLLVGNGGVNLAPAVGQAVNTNNYELGANKAPTPSISGFGDSVNASSLNGNVPDIPTTAQVVGTGIGGGGNIAITSQSGVYNLQDVGVYADPEIGIKCAQNIANCDAGTQNSFFNDPNQYPNTFVPDLNPDGTIDSPTGTNNVTGEGVTVNPNDADQTTSIGTDRGPGYVGVSQFTTNELTDLRNEIFDGSNSAFQVIPGLTATGTLYIDDGTIQPDENAIFNGSSSVGSFEKSDATKRNTNDAPYEDFQTVTGGTYTLKLAKGLHVIDIDANDNDFVLNNINFVVDSLSDNPDDTFVIFRLKEENMSIANSNVLAGNNIGLNNVLFFSEKPDNNEHFNISNSVINGAAFWTTAQTGGEINVNNSQGCTQLVADKINLNDVRYNRCSFSTKLYKEFTYEPKVRVPEPGSVIALAFIGGGIFLTRRRQKD